MPNRSDLPLRSLLSHWHRTSVGIAFAGALPFLGFVLWLQVGSSAAQTTTSLRFHSMPAFDLPVGDDLSLQALTLADVNADGQLDLITVNQPEDAINVLRGTGEGTFEEPTKLATDGLSPAAVAVADVASPFGSGSQGNTDGNVDIIAGYEDGVIQVFLGKGDGTFDPPEEDFEEFLDASSVLGLAFGDFDKNGTTDIAVLDDSGEEVFFLCNRAGTFSYCPTASLETGGAPIKILAGGFNGDSRADIAVLNVDSRSISVMRSSGVGTFADPDTVELRAEGDGEPVDFATAKLDDGPTDDLVVMTNETFFDLNCEILLGSQRSGFSSTLFGASPAVVSIALQNFDGSVDGSPDLLVRGEDLTALVGNGAGELIDVGGIGVVGGLAASALIVGGDVGDDSFGDFVVVSDDGTRMQVALNDSAKPTPTFTPGSPPISTATTTGSPGPTNTPTATMPTPTITLTPTATRQPTVNYGRCRAPVGGALTDIATADLDGDSAPDIAV